MTLDFKKLVLNSVKKEMSIQHFECNAQLFKKEELPQSVLEKIQQTYGNDFAEDANYTLWFSGNNLTKETIEKTIFKICNNALGRAANNMNESDLKTLDLGGGTAQPPPETPANQVDSLADADADEANGEALADLIDQDPEANARADAAAGAENAEGDQNQIDAEVRDELDGDGDEEDQIAADVDDELEKDDSGDEDDFDDADLDSEIDDELDDEDDSGSDDEDEDSDEDSDEDDDEDEEDDEELDESVEAPAAGEKFVFIKITMK